MCEILLINAKPKKPSPPRPLQADPTRTVGLVRPFLIRLRFWFNGLEKEIRQFIVDEDVFGLKPISHDPFVINTFDPNQPRDEHGRWTETLGKLPESVFDNIKNSRGLMLGLLSGVNRHKLLVDRGADMEAVKEMDQLFTSHKWGKEHQDIADKRIAEEFDKPTKLGKALRIQSELETELLVAWEKYKPHIAKIHEEETKKEMKEAWDYGYPKKNDWAYNSWEEQWEIEHKYEVDNLLKPTRFYRKGDATKDILPTSLNPEGAQSHTVIGDAHQAHFIPTHEFTIQDLISKGYRVLGGLGYIEMGYSGESEVTWIKSKIPTINTRWRFETNPQKLKLFQDWLKKTIGKHLKNQAIDKLWELYILEGFKKGAGRAFDDTKQEENQKPDPLTAGTKLDFYNGTKAEFLRSAFGQPESVDKVKLLASRTYDGMEGITTTMSTKMSRLLTDGLVQGQNPRTIAANLVKEIGITRSRAETIARTELVRAHAEGQLMAFQKLGVEEVGAAVEWSTAGDSRVCPLCRPLEGVILKTAEATGMIPRHPNCRCAWIPANVGEKNAAQLKTKAEIEKAILKSAKLGGDKFSSSTTISKQRPGDI